MTFSATIQPIGGARLRIDVQGQVLGTAATDLEVMITHAIVARLPDTLRINLRHVTALGITGVHATLAGYLTAIDYGTTYRVLHAHGDARHVLQTTGTLDVLTNNDDLGALLLAVLALPNSGAPA